VLDADAGDAARPLRLTGVADLQAAAGHHRDDQPVGVGVDGVVALEPVLAEVGFPGRSPRSGPGGGERWSPALIAADGRDEVVTATGVI
jgi:hypothetical protein